MGEAGNWSHRHPRMQKRHTATARPLAPRAPQNRNTMPLLLPSLALLALALA
eukprot:COSAG06_NODE_16939_length_969_cov_46.122706_2_plen_51_part_01